MTDYPETPDGRYFVSKGRLWRKSDPRLDEETRDRLVHELMDARRAVGQATDDDQERAARARVDTAKRALGERGPVWWDDGAPDRNRYAPKNTDYAEWWDDLGEAARRKGEV